MGILRPRSGFDIVLRNDIAEDAVGIGSSPKEVIKAAGDGFLTFTTMNLRPYGTSEKLRQLINEIIILERTYRNEIIGEEDFEGNRKKHFRLGNLRKARLTIEGFAKSRRIPL